MSFSCTILSVKLLKFQYRFFFLCQNRKSEFSIDILFVWEVFLSDVVGVHKKYFAKLVKNPSLSAVLHKCALYEQTLHIF